MTSVERARRFIQARGKAIAMTIAPLAMIAVAASQPVRAANVVVFSPEGCDVTFDGSFGQPVKDCGTTPIPGFQNNANGLKLTGTATVQAVSGGFGSISFDYWGTANEGTPQGSLPLHWDFTVGSQQIPAAAPPGLSSGSFSLEYSFNDGSFSRFESGGLTFNSDCGDYACAHITGDDFFPVDGAVNSYSVSLAIQGYFLPGSFVQVTIPGNSIDLNAQQGETPEPASIALGATGLLGLALSRLRRRRKA
jgi:MYXO-CTERM domain-containing protein